MADHYEVLGVSRPTLYDWLDGNESVRFLPVDMESDCESCHSLVYDRVGTLDRTRLQLAVRDDLVTHQLAEPGLRQPLRHRAMTPMIQLRQELLPARELHAAAWREREIERRAPRPRERR